MAWGLAAAAAVVPVPVPRSAGAVLGPVPFMGYQGAVVVRPAESAVGVAAAVTAEGAASLVAIRGGRDGSRILRSWLSFSTTFANPSTPTQTFLFPT